MSTFDSIKVDLQTGAIEYPSPEGFTLDMEAVYRTARIHAAFCSMEMAVRHAIHGQIEAFRGAQSLLRRRA